MKLLSLIAISLSATSAIACPNLSGKYKVCTDYLEVGTTQVSVSQKVLSSGFTQFTITTQIRNKTTQEVFVADGKETAYDSGVMAFTCTKDELIGVVDATDTNFPIVLGLIMKKIDGRFTQFLEFAGEREMTLECK